MDYKGNVSIVNSQEGIWKGPRWFSNESGHYLQSAVKWKHIAITDTSYFVPDSDSKYLRQRLTDNANLPNRYKDCATVQGIPSQDEEMLWQEAYLERQYDAAIANDDMKEAEELAKELLALENKILDTPNCIER